MILVKILNDFGQIFNDFDQIFNDFDQNRKGFWSKSGRILVKIMKCFGYNRKRFGQNLLVKILNAN